MGRRGAVRPARTHGRRDASAVVAVVAVVVAIRALLLVPVTVDGSSMEPTLADGDVVLVLRTADATDRLRHGDLVVFRGDSESLSVKRVVGLPDDRVAMLDARLTVDGRVVDEPYVDHSRIDGTYLGEVVVPAGSVFVLGDNRARSTDSREYGPVSEADLVGRVLLHW
ncbi:signal peptidase I [Cellulomonas aerilata]|uniref:Signal peptidase I n=1 Tax=Cellulomonas aerilata TaxID=515326 RepID=A0A512D751_9CELL|nr:signal peptidase I [Cellulomonas aerilata]GEO32311.1 signal peptidase I [Cellulomonas aerilata]